MRIDFSTFLIDNHITQESAEITSLIFWILRVNYPQRIGLRLISKIVFFFLMFSLFLSSSCSIFELIIWFNDKNFVKDRGFFYNYFKVFLVYLIWIFSDLGILIGCEQLIQKNWSESSKLMGCLPNKLVLGECNMRWDMKLIN